MFLFFFLTRDNSGDLCAVVGLLYIYMPAQLIEEVAEDWKLG